MTRDIDNVCRDLESQRLLKLIGVHSKAIPVEYHEHLNKILNAVEALIKHNIEEFQ